MNSIFSVEKSTRLNVLMNLLNELGFKTISEFQVENKLKPDGIFGENSYNVLYNLLLDVKLVKNFKDFVDSPTSKRQIIWHHTEGYDNALGVYEWWSKDRLRQVSTSVVIEKNGVVFKGFDEQYWSFNLGVTARDLKKFNSSVDNLFLSRNSIAVEITNAGGLDLQKNKFIAKFGGDFTNSKIELDFRGFKAFDIYTAEQLRSLKYWTLLNALRFDIPLTYDYDALFTQNKKALNGEKGVFTHCSFRPSGDKQDLSPQPDLIKMAKSLIDYEQ